MDSERTGVKDAVQEFCAESYDKWNAREEAREKAATVEWRRRVMERANPEGRLALKVMADGE